MSRVDGNDSPDSGDVLFETEDRFVRIQSERSGRNTIGKLHHGHAPNHCGEKRKPRTKKSVTPDAEPMHIRGATPARGQVVSFLGIRRKE